MYVCEQLEVHKKDIYWKENVLLIKKHVQFWEKSCST